MSEQTAELVKAGEHAFLLLAGSESFAFAVTLERCGLTEKTLKPMLPADAVQSSKEGWKDYWTRTGIIQLHESRDERANELERRIVLSQYLLAANCSGPYRLRRPASPVTDGMEKPPGNVLLA